MIFLNRYNKLYKNMMAILLLLYIGIILALNLFAPTRVFSDSENRNLEQLPELSLSSLVSGKFTSSYEKYISDQFAGRDFWIGVKSDADRAIGKKESNGVYLGKDGYLIQKFNRPADRDLEDKIKAINSFDNATPDLHKYVMLVPTAVQVLDDKLPNFATDSNELAYMRKVKGSINKNMKFVDVYPTLNSMKEQYIFYKTDHHWTTTGAFYAYQELSNQMGFVPKRADDFNIKEVTKEFYGSLYSKSGFRHLEPDRIQLFEPKEHEKYKVEYVEEHQNSDSLYVMDNIYKKDKYTVFMNGNHAFVKIKTGNPEGKKLLIVKDSYANSFISFLTAHYSEIFVVDLRYYEDSLETLVRNNQIHDMLMLYNINTFFEDPSIKNVSEGIE